MNPAVIAFIGVAAAGAVAFRKLTKSGGIAGASVGLCVYAGIGLGGLTMLAMFFIAGTVVTGWKRHKKQPVAGLDPLARTAGQVLANGGVAALAGLGACLFPGCVNACLLLAAGALAAATSDTLSSELGMVYGRRFYNVLTFKRDVRGLDGVISLEGIVAGVAGAMIIALCLTASTGRYANIPDVAAAGMIGNLADSVLGALFERKHALGNNTVNFFNTVAGALSALLLSSL